MVFYRNRQPALCAYRSKTAPRKPLTLPPGWGEEFSACYQTTLDALNGAPHNGYWNDGYHAGQRILGHWHVRVEPRLADQPSSGMGLGLLITKYNQVMGAK